MFGSHKIESLCQEDSDVLRDLMQRYVPEISPATIEDLDVLWPFYRVMKAEDGGIVGACALCPLSPRRSEIRGLVCHERWRSKGLATALVEDALAAADNDGVDVVCVTRRPDFFARLGFEPTRPWPEDFRSASSVADTGLAPRTPMLRPRTPRFSHLHGSLLGWRRHQADGARHIAEKSFQH